MNALKCPEWVSWRAFWRCRWTPRPEVALIWGFWSVAWDCGGWHLRIEKHCGLFQTSDNQGRRVLVRGWIGAEEGRGVPEKEEGCQRRKSGAREGNPAHFLPLCPGRLGTKCRNRPSLLWSPSFLVQKWAFTLLLPEGPSGTILPV